MRLQHPLGDAPKPQDHISYRPLIVPKEHIFRTPGDNLTIELLAHQISIAIENGRLTSTCPKIIKSNQALIISEILELMGKKNAYQYERYTTGRYDFGKRKLPGVTLQFTNLSTGEEAYSIFDVKSLKGQRKSKNREAGLQRPAGHFVPKGKRSNLWKFWLRTQLREPRCPSVFHEEMSKLDQLIYVCRHIENCRVQNENIDLLSVTYEELQAAYQHLNYIQ